MDALQTVTKPQFTHTENQIKFPCVEELPCSWVGNILLVIFNMFDMTLILKEDHTVFSAPEADIPTAERPSVLSSLPWRCFPRR